MKRILMIGLIMIPAAFMASAQKTAFQPIKLPAPQMSGGKPLMEALKDRKTERKFSDQKLEQQMLSSLLWAAYGINRPDEGKRTAPSAMNWQEMDLYVCLKEGIYIYNAKSNILDTIVSGDFRKKMGKLGYVEDAPLVLVYVADYSHMSVADKENKDFYSAVDAGFISQNVYLFCASEGLSTVVMGYINREEIPKILNLSKDQKVIVAQCVGFPDN
jgi:SagB-type dehydrogenase family enzyme